MYSKMDVDFHSDGYRPGNPAVNVKVHHLLCSTDDIMERFNCSEESAEKALEYAFESACDDFWNSLQELTDYILQMGKVYQEGRSGGWAVVHDLPDFKSWDAVMLSKWRKFVNAVLDSVKYLTSKKHLLEVIDVNNWHLEGSEKYNFIATKSGESVCIANEKMMRK